MAGENLSIVIKILPNSYARKRMSFSRVKMLEVIVKDNE